MSKETVIKILFVCYGNTCRSPMAEAVFNDIIKNQNVGAKFEIDSAGISSWQAGQEPNDYVKEILDRHQIQVMHKARKITVSDFETYDFIVGMDLYNIYELGRYADALKSKAKIHLLGEFNPNTSDNIIADPYFDNKKEDFEKCFEQISTSCSEFLKRLLSRNNGQEY